MMCMYERGGDPVLSNGDQEKKLYFTKYFSVL